MTWVVERYSYADGDPALDFIKQKLSGSGDFVFVIDHEADRFILIGRGDDASLREAGIISSALNRNVD